jgi:hypothetical protein
MICIINLIGQPGLNHQCKQSLEETVTGFGDMLN